MRVCLTKLTALIVCLATGVAACRTEPDSSAAKEDPVAARAVLSRLQDRVRLQLSKEPVRVDESGAELPPPTHPALGGVAAPELEALNDSYAAHFAQARSGTTRAADVKLPVFSDAPFQLRDETTRATIEARLKGAGHSPAVSTDGFLVYRDVTPGMHLVQQPLVEGAEDYLWVDKALPNDELVYEVTLGEGIAGVRHVANVIEFLDADGTPRLRVNPPYLVDSWGHQQDVTVSVRGCAVDRSPAPPWGRAVTPPGANRCEIALKWNPVSWWSYPILVDPAWTTTGQMATARQEHAALKISNTRVLVTGGVTGSGSITATAEVWDGSTGTWSSVNSMNTARADHTMTALDSTTFLVAGGRNGSSGALTSSEEGSTSTGNWSNQNTMSTARVYHAAVQLTNGRTLVSGGQSSGGTPLTSSEYYSPTFHSWNSTDALNTARTKHRMVHLGSGNVVLALGGQNSSGTALSSAELYTYDLVSASWTATNSMNVQRSSPAATLLGNGNVLVAGGDQSTAALSSAEVFNASSSQWNSTTSMSQTRTIAAMVTLSDGSAMVTGGLSGVSGRTSTQVYSSGSWSSVLSMTTDHYYHTATALADGSVLVVGGLSSGSATKISEIVYMPVTCSSSATCASGNCIDGYCCNTSCSNGPCDRCNIAGSEGTCTTAPSTSDGSPTCSPYLCSGTSPACATSCADSSTCASGNYCKNNACTPTLPNGGTCSFGYECTSGSCVDGVCCNTACDGNCDVCSAAFGATANGTCTILPNGNPGRPTCAPYICGGTTAACTTTCTTDSQCASDAVCISNQCYTKANQGGGCFADKMCYTGHCADTFCCDQACSGNCDVCSAALGATADGTCTVFAKGTVVANCAPYRCNGTIGTCPTSCTLDSDCSASNYFCDNGQCNVRRPAGGTCTVDNECQTGHCADLRCCNTACSGSCDFCSVATGATTDGTCSNVAGSVGAPACGAYLCSASSASCPSTCTADTQCATGQYCDTVAHQCVSAVTNGSVCSKPRMCASGNCIDGYCCDTACSGGCDACNVAGKLGQCSPVAQGSAGNPVCTGFVCDGLNVACPTICTGPAQCSSSNYCANTNLCAPKRATGQSCLQNTECSSGNCADGYCCDGACSGTCDACSVALGATSNGHCTNLSAAVTGPGNNGACAPYKCSGTTNQCAATCNVDGDCASGYCTAAKTCSAQKASGSTCSRGPECSSGSCTDGMCCNSGCGGPCDVCTVALGATADGTCTTVPVGTTPSASCGTYLCGGTSPNCPTSCTSDANCTGNAYCNGTTCVTGKANGTTCTADRQCGSGHCADGFCCDSDCAGTCNACAQALGATQNGACTVLPARSPGVGGACAPLTCNGTDVNCLTSCTQDSDCVSGNYCNASGQCVPTQAAAATCTRNGQCTSGSCADGFCCNTACGGNCDVCAKSLGATANGTCTIVAKGASGVPACNFYVCDGTKATCPTSCTTDANCDNQSYCYTDASLNKFCTPKNPDGLSCTSGNSCLSGNCADGFCCNSTCNGSCDVCAVSMGATANGVCTPAPRGAVGAPTICSPGRCDGTNTTCSTTCTDNNDCAATAYCSAGQCIAKKELGSVCSSALDCISGQCADGFCCNSSCNGACDRCDVAGKQGTCSALPAGSTGTPACGNNLLCSGTSGSCPSSCVDDSWCTPGTFCSSTHTCLPASATGSSCLRAGECASNNCSDGFCCDTACSGSCDVCAKSVGAVANGTCTLLAAGARGNPSCTPYFCDGTSASCANSCITSNDCASTDFCSGGECKRKLTNGNRCQAANDCSSGSCVDGFCCNTSCTEQCAACDVSGKEGTCSPATGEPHGNRTACDTDGSECGGLCNGVVATACVFPPITKTCGDAFCQGTSNVPPSTCNGHGTCVANSAVDCTPYQCEAGVGCLSRCAQDPDCVGGAFCSSGACIPLRGLSDSCARDSECTTGHCADGYCCDSICDGACARCDAPNREGLCTPLPALTPDEAGECAPMLCDGSSLGCPELCQSSTDCAANYICVDGHCTEKQAQGRTCTASSECGTGFCVDGFCCESACKGSCATCGMPGKEGQCSLVVGDAAPGRTACAGEGVCGGTCTGTQSDCSFPAESTVCAPAFCSQAKETATSTCDGAGTCSPGTQTDCVSGCNGDHCAPRPVAKTGGCASAESAAAGLLVIAAQLSLMWKRRRKAAMLRR